MVVRRIREDELYHHGVKGMRWGVRHERERTGTGRSGGGQTSDSSGSNTVQTTNGSVQKKKKKLSKEAKRNIAITAAAAGSVLLLRHNRTKVKKLAAKGAEYVGKYLKMQEKPNAYRLGLPDNEVKTYSKARVNMWQKQADLKNKASAAKAKASEVKSKVADAYNNYKSRQETYDDAQEQIKRFRRMYGSGNGSANIVVRRR